MKLSLVKSSWIW